MVYNSGAMNHHSLCQFKRFMSCNTKGSTTFRCSISLLCQTKLWKRKFTSNLVCIILATGVYFIFKSHGFSDILKYKVFESPSWIFGILELFSTKMYIFLVDKMEGIVICQKDLPILVKSTPIYFEYSFCSIIHM